MAQYFCAWNILPAITNSALVDAEPNGGKGILWKVEIWLIPLSLIGTLQIPCMLTLRICHPPPIAMVVKTEDGVYSRKITCSHPERYDIMLFDKCFGRKLRQKQCDLIHDGLVYWHQRELSFFCFFRISLFLFFLYHQTHLQSVGLDNQLKVVTGQALLVLPR